VRHQHVTHRFHFLMTGKLAQVKRIPLTAAAAITLLALTPVLPVQAATRPLAHLYFAPAAVRPGGTFAIITVCPGRHATPLVSSALLPGPVELDGGISPSFALYDVAGHARPGRYLFTLTCVSGHRATRARATLTVLGTRRTRKASFRKIMIIQAGYGGMDLAVASHRPGG
jgi:hypothetical protein